MTDLKALCKLRVILNGGTLSKRRASSRAKTLELDFSRDTRDYLVTVLTLQRKQAQKGGVSG